MSKEEQENRIIVDHVYKTFNIYMDKANSLKEKVLFWNRNKKEKREVLKDINLTIKNGEAVALIGVNGSCHVPMGAYCEIVGDQLKLTGLYGNEEGSKLVIKTLEGSIESPIDLGVELAQLVLKEYENYEG